MESAFLILAVVLTITTVVWLIVAVMYEVGRPPRTAIVVTLGAAAIAFFLAYVVQNIWADIDNPKERWQIVATPGGAILAGTAALTAGILTYVNGERNRASQHIQHQHDLEIEQAKLDAAAKAARNDSDRAAENARREEVAAMHGRFIKAADLMSEEALRLREAGIYAMLALADDWEAFARQMPISESKARTGQTQCLNMLTSYLRANELMPFGTGPIMFDERLDTDRQFELDIRRAIVRNLAAKPASWYPAGYRFELRGTDLRGVDASGWQLANADLVDADLRGARLVQTVLDNASLEGALFDCAYIRRVRLDGATVSGSALKAVDATWIGNFWDFDDVPPQD